MKKNTRNILIGTGIATTGIGAAAFMSYVIMKGLVEVALDRKTPKIMETNKSLITGSIKDPELATGLQELEDKLANSGCETVETVSHDGLRLVGHWREGENPKRVIIAMHGWRSRWTKDFCGISSFWHENECAVLYPDQRGQGESEGDYMTFGLLERFDCLEWIKWVNEKTEGKLPIYLCGISMGATTVLMAGGSEMPESVKGIIADCGFTSPHDIWKHVVSKNMHIPYTSIQATFAEVMSKKKIDMSPNGYSTLSAMNDCRVPVLFIHGSDDHFVPVKMTFENYKACNAPKHLLIVPGAEHGMSYVVDKESYENAVISFWNTYDK